MIWKEILCRWCRVVAHEVAVDHHHHFAMQIVTDGGFQQGIRGFTNKNMKPMTKAVADADRRLRWWAK